MWWKRFLVVVFLCLCHTQWCRGLTSKFWTQRSFLAMLTGTYVVLEIEYRSAKCLNSCFIFPALDGTDLSTETWTQLIPVPFPFPFPWPDAYHLNAYKTGKEKRSSTNERWFVMFYYVTQKTLNLCFIIMIWFAGKKEEMTDRVKSKILNSYQQLGQDSQLTTISTGFPIDIINWTSYAKLKPCIP